MLAKRLQPVADRLHQLIRQHGDEQMPFGAAFLVVEHRPQAQLRLEAAEQPAERIVARDTVLELEEAAQERLFRLREQCHVHRALPATQYRAQGNHQNLMEVVQTGIAGSPVLKTLPARDKLIQGVPSPGVFRPPTGRIDHARLGKPESCQGNSKCDSPGWEGRFLGLLFLFWVSSASRQRTVRRN